LSYTRERETDRSSDRSRCLTTNPYLTRCASLIPRAVCGNDWERRPDTDYDRRAFDFAARADIIPAWTATRSSTEHAAMVSPINSSGRSSTRRKRTHDFPTS